MDFENEINHALEESLRTQREFWQKHRGTFFKAAEMLWAAVQSDKKVLIFGNGGSACDALHFAGEWVNRYKRDRRPLPCLALTADAPLITCIGNDASFDEIFEKPVQAFGQTDDIAIGISTSGNSENVIRGLYAARARGMQTLALVGGTGGRIIRESHADIVLNVDSSTTTARIQETHEWILHAFCEYIDLQLLGPELHH